MTTVQSISTLKQAQNFFATMIKTEARCLQCQKLLAKYNQYGLIAAEIKCPRCGHLNNF
jgi:DNA-directed RNA polymerase subunit RPC12/RpoP